ncbi:MAG: AAA family ATPase [Thermoplasmata archaeon]
MLITISGLPGCGKTTVAKLLSQKLLLRYVSAGESFRKMAEQKNMSLLDFGEYSKAHPEVDREIDQAQLEMAKDGNAVMDGRLSGWLAKTNNIKALKIWLNAPLKTRAERIAKRENIDMEVSMRDIKRREDCERERYEKLYNVNMSNSLIYNMIVDANKKTPEEICKLILDEVASIEDRHTLSFEEGIKNQIKTNK